MDSLSFVRFNSDNLFNLICLELRKIRKADLQTKALYTDIEDIEYQKIEIIRHN